MTQQDDRRLELDALLDRIRLGWRGLEAQTLTDERLKMREDLLDTVLEFLCLLRPCHRICAVRPGSQPLFRVALNPAARSKALGHLLGQQLFE